MLDLTFHKLLRVAAYKLVRLRWSKQCDPSKILISINFAITTQARTLKTTKSNVVVKPALLVIQQEVKITLTIVPNYSS
jgi:hypothetical protein